MQGNQRLPFAGVNTPPRAAGGGGGAGGWGASVFNTPPRGMDGAPTGGFGDDSFTSGSDWTAGGRTSTGSSSPLLSLGARGGAGAVGGQVLADLYKSGFSSAHSSAHTTPSTHQSREERHGYVQSFAPPPLGGGEADGAPGWRGVKAGPVGGGQAPPQWMLDELLGRVATPKQQTQKDPVAAAPAVEQLSAASRAVGAPGVNTSPAALPAAAVPPTPPTPPLPPLIPGAEMQMQMQMQAAPQAQLPCAEVISGASSQGAAAAPVFGASPPVPGLLPLEGDAPAAAVEAKAAPHPDFARKLFDLQMLEALCRTRLERCVFPKKNHLMSLVAECATGTEPRALTTLLPVDRANHDAARLALRIAVLCGDAGTVGYILTNTSFAGMHQVGLQARSFDRDEQDNLYVSHLPPLGKRLYAATRKCDTFFTLALELCLMAAGAPALDDSTKVVDPAAPWCFQTAAERAVEVQRRVEVWQALTQSAYACPNLVFDAVDATLHVSCRREPLAPKPEPGRLRSLCSTPSRKNRDDDDDDEPYVNPYLPPAENAVGIFNTGVKALDETLFFWRNYWLVASHRRHERLDESDPGEAGPAPADAEAKYFSCCATYQCHQPSIPDIAVSPALLRPTSALLSPSKAPKSFAGCYGMHWSEDSHAFFSAVFRAKARVVVRALHKRLHSGNDKYIAQHRNAHIITEVVGYMDWSLAGPVMDKAYPLRQRLPRSDAAARLGAGVGGVLAGAGPRAGDRGGRGGLQPAPLSSGGRGGGKGGVSLPVAMMRAAQAAAVQSQQAPPPQPSAMGGRFAPPPERPSESNKISFLNYSLAPPAKDLFDISAALAPYGVYTGQKVSLSNGAGGRAQGVIIGVGRDGHLYWTKDSRGAVRLQMAPEVFRSLLEKDK